MKRMFVLAFLPLVLFALETVNLIKAAGFEKDSELWRAYAAPRVANELDSAIANRHDLERAFSGDYSGSCDTRTTPGDPYIAYNDSAVLVQGFCCRKIVADIDSLIISYSIAPTSMGYSLLDYAFVALHLNADEPTCWFAGYGFKASDLAGKFSPPLKSFETIILPKDSSWYLLSKDIHSDIEGAGIVAPDASVDSILFWGWGTYFPPWRGQKVYWDDVRLMGYADYDVGVKEILSGDSLREGHPYTPEARIKNFGREPADEFSVVAEIWDGETQVYYDSLPWSLAGDTEDIASFAEFTPERPSSYILTIRTVMEPDECDEDDQLSKPLYYEGITEALTTDLMTLEVHSLTTPLRVAYSLPYAESGTLTLYDATGRRVERANIRGGSGSVEFTSALPSGVYFVRLESADLTITRKTLVLR
ncbi:hypothetical protein ES703_16454 [subsurface metagenome]|nr:T9SS type A sorting domain-containing protein [bacterium]